MPRVWTEEQKQQMRETQRLAHERDRRRPAYVPPPPPLSGVSVNCSARLDLDGLSALSPAQTAAVMHGIAQVIAASK